MFFSGITKNLNWETLTKNQSLLKDEAGLRKKNFNILGSSLKNPIFRGWGFPINQCIGGNYLKRGLGQLPNLRGILAKKWGGIFEGVGGGDTLMHTMVGGLHIGGQEHSTNCVYFLFSCHLKENLQRFTIKIHYITLTYSNKHTEVCGSKFIV